MKILTFASNLLGCLVGFNSFYSVGLIVGLPRWVASVGLIGGCLPSGCLPSGSFLPGSFLISVPSFQVILLYGCLPSGCLPSGCLKLTKKKDIKKLTKY